MKRATLQRPTGKRNPFLIETREWTLIRDVLTLYTQEYGHRSKLVAYRVEEAISHFLTTAKIHDSQPMCSITKEVCKAWKVAMLSGTAHRHPGRAGMKAPTISKKMASVSHWLEWATNQDYLEKNPLRGLSLPARLVSLQRTKKAGFTPEQLETILAYLPDERAGKADQKELYWSVLCLVMTGAKASEILQLYRSDIRQIDEVWCFDILAGPGQRVKNAASVRRIPLHSQLIEHGFLAWLQDIKGRVFPLLYDRGVPTMSGVFSRLLEKAALKTPALSLHSLRHTMAQRLTKARVFPAITHRLLGHSQGSGVEERVYLGSLEFDIKELQSALELVRFPLSGEGVA
jgi:integrase